MSFELKAGQWYRDRQGAVWYCISTSAPRCEDQILFVCENIDRNCDFFRENGLHSDPNEKLRNLIEHLPDCTGFDWEPPEPQPKYRPFKNAEEFKPHRDRWIQRSSKHDTEETKPQGCFRVTAYNDHHVWTDQFPESYETMFNDGKKFEDGTPFGVRVEG